MIGRISLGVPGSLGEKTIARVAPLIEAMGYAGLWVNDTRDGDSIAALAAAAATTTRLRLGAGVIPIDRRAPSDILAAIRRRNLPEARLTIGIGAGAPGRGTLDRVSGAISELRDGAPDAVVVVGALGPRMRDLAATRSDGVLLNWIPTAAVGAQASEIRARGTEERGTAPRVIVYARAIVDDAARPALEAEAARYAAVPAYAANFSVSRRSRPRCPARGSVRSSREPATTSPASTSSSSARSHPTARPSSWSRSWSRRHARCRRPTPPRAGSRASTTGSPTRCSPPNG
jgi:alkanesulfonate monooxygenase SsuD/methylene tetrahydromethanopterin reductase-like flavin-dependent oxidoreductase (luciferase family)